MVCPQQPAILHLKQRQLAPHGMSQAFQNLQLLVMQTVITLCNVAQWHVYVQPMTASPHMFVHGMHQHSSMDSATIVCEAYNLIMTFLLQVQKQLQLECTTGAGYSQHFLVCKPCICRQNNMCCRLLSLASQSNRT